MDVHDQIEMYITGFPEPKRSEIKELHLLILKLLADGKLWFLDGKNADGKTVSNPNIGYGSQIMTYADGKSREFYKVGLSGNTSGISLYILGIKDKNFLAETYGEQLGKASVTGYCIKFRTLKNVTIETLVSAIRYGLERKIQPK